jgi:hypothetical protein
MFMSEEAPVETTCGREDNAQPYALFMNYRIPNISDAEHLSTLTRRTLVDSICISARVKAGNYTKSFFLLLYILDNDAFP